MNFNIRQETPDDYHCLVELTERVFKTMPSSTNKEGCWQRARCRETGNGRWNVQKVMVQGDDGTGVRNLNLKPSTITFLTIVTLSTFM